VKRIALILLVLCLASAAIAGFKAKNIKAKKPEQFQSRVTVADVTFGADLLLEGKDQKMYFYKELTPSNVIAVRLAIFNNGKDEVIVPLEGLQLLDPGGNEMPPVSPEKVADALLGGKAIGDQAKRQTPQGQIGVGGTQDPRSDPTNPQYDPRLDPNNPRYDPTDPRNRGQYPPGSNPGGTNTGTYPPSTYPPGSNPPGSRPPGTSLPGTYPTGTRQGIPGVILTPGGGGGGDLSQFERQLAEKDFSDKAHTTDPVPVSTNRDRFLYFSVRSKPAAEKEYTLRLPISKGIPQEVVLKF
jgi:hypothetical protein